MVEKNEIAIAGADAAGLTLAATLAKSGFNNTTLFENSTFLSGADYGVILWPGAWEIIRNLGLAETIKSYAFPQKEIVLLDREGEKIQNFPINNTYTISRALLYRAFGQMIGANSIQERSQLTDFETQHNEVALNFRDGGQRKFSMLAGADGNTSLIREKLLNDGKPMYAGFKMWKAIINYCPPGLEQDKMRVYTSRGRRAGIIPLGKDRTCWWAVSEEAFRNIHHMSGRKKKLTLMFKGWPAPLAEMINATPEAEIVKVLSYERKPLKGWSNGKVVLTGDAAHPISPLVLAAESLAIEDGWILGNLLKNAGNVQAAFKEFEEKRFDRISILGALARDNWEAGLEKNYLFYKKRDTGLVKKTGSVLKELLNISL